MPEPAAPPPRHGRLRRWLVRPLVWTLAILAVLGWLVSFLLDSDFLRQRGRALVVARLSEALGRPVEVGSVELRLVPLTVELVDLRIPGPRPQDPPLAVVPRVRVEGEIESIRRGVLRLREITLERPELVLEVHADGTTNLPSLGGGVGGAGFEVRLDAVRVIDGGLRLDEQRVPLDFAARAVRAHLVGARGGELGGQVAAQEIELRLPKARPYPFSLSGRVRLGAKGLVVESARLVGAEIAASGHGAVHWKPQLDGRFEVIGETSNDFFERLGYLHGEVQARPHFEGVVGWGPQGFLAKGRFASAEAAFVGRHLEAVQGSIAVDAHAVRVEVERGTYHGGSMAGSFVVTLGVNGVPADLAVHVENADLVPLLREQQVPIEFVAGRASGDFTYHFTFEDTVHGSGRGDATVVEAVPVGRELALAGAAALSIERGQLHLERVDLHSPTETVHVEGRLDIPRVAGSFDIHVESTALGELAVVLPPSVAEPPPLWFPTRGGGTADVALGLEGGALTLGLDLDLHDVEAPGVKAARVHGELAILPQAVDGLHFEFERPGGTLRVSGRIPLGGGPGAAAGDGGLGLEIVAQGWPYEEARPWLPRQLERLPVAGGFSGTVHLTGRLDDPSGDAAGELEPARWAGFDLGRLRTAFRFDPDGVTVERATLEAPSGTLTAHGTLRYAGQALDVAFEAPALRLEAPPLADAVGGRLVGKLALLGHLGGTVDRPRMHVRAATSELVLAGQALPGEAVLEADWDGESLAAHGSLLGLVEMRGGGPLHSDRADLKFDVESAALQKLVELGLGSAQPDLAGHLTGTLAVRGGPAAGQPLIAELRLTDVEARYGAHTFALREPAVVRLAGGRLSIESLYLAEPSSRSELFVAGDVGLGGAAPLDLKLQAALDSDWVDLLGPAIRGEGQLELLGTVRGTLAHPQLNGQAVAKQARLILLGFPHALEGLDATLFFYPSQIVLDSLSGRLGGGTVSASGSLPLDGAESGTYRFQAALSDVTLRWPEGWLLRGSGELTLVSAGDGRQVRGSITLDRAYYLQDIKVSVAQLIQKVLQKQRLEVTDTTPLLANTQLAIGLRAPGTLRVHNNLASLRGTADLTLRGTLAAPVVFGRADIDAGGKVTYGDNDYAIDRAVVLFTNPYRFEPALDVVARTKVNDYRITVSLNGRLERLNVNFASDPPVSDLDVFSLLATGRPSSTAPGLPAQQPGTPAQSYGALGFLYGQAASMIGQRVSSLFGLDTFRVDPLTTSGDSVASLRWTVGKRLRRDLFVTYTVDPASTKEQYVKVEWQMRPEVAVVLTQNSDGTYAVDLRWERRF